MQITKQPAILLAIAFFTLLSHSATAQRRDREREPDRNMEREREPEADRAPTTGLASKLWYGGGVNIGFGGYNGYTSFNFGISPMVGYKIVKGLSAGPRIAYDFNSLKQRGYASFGLHSFDVGAFVRYRVFRGLFLQGELSNQWYQDLLYNGVNYEKFNDQRVNQRIGAGWNFGDPGGAGSEISVLYNFKIANDIDTYLSPFEYRFGFTWRF